MQKTISLKEYRESILNKPVNFPLRARGSVIVPKSEAFKLNNGTYRFYYDTVSTAISNRYEYQTKPGEPCFYGVTSDGTMNTSRSLFKLED